MQLFFGTDSLAQQLGDPHSWWIWLLLFAAATIAGLVDTIAGGGGMITLPALLAIGLPPHLALGTNKLQSSFGSFTASLRFRSAGLISLRSFIPGIVATALGAGLGACVVGFVDTSILKLLIPLLLAVIFVFLLFSPRFGITATDARWPRPVIWWLAGLGLGFYDGFFGPGTGTFWAMVLVGLAGMNLQTATAHTKAVNFTSNIVGFGVFLVSGSLVLVIGLMMGAGQVVGAWIGSHLVLKRGVGLVRRMVMVMTALMIIWLVVRYFIQI